MKTDRRRFLTAGGVVAGTAATALATTSAIGVAAWCEFSTPQPRCSYQPQQIADVHEFLGVFGALDTGFIPNSQRRPNLNGSCVHLSIRNLLLGLGLYQQANLWSSMYSGGETFGRLADRLTRAGIRFAMETRGDARFLDWSCGNLGGAHRGAAITLLGAHVLNLMDLDPAGTPGAQGKFLNNWKSNFQNETATVWSRERLLADWRRRGGYAVAIISDRDGRGTPPPPDPFIEGL